MDITQWYAQVDNDLFVLQCSPFKVDHEGPPPPFVLGEWRILLDGEPDWRLQPSLTCKLKWVQDGPHIWVETAPLAELQAAAIADTYVDVDGVYQQAVGMRATEYARAEEAALAYLAADPKPAVVSGYITGHAERNPTGQIQTNEWAAQQIIERADAFRWAELQMRNLRFARQVDMRAAVTHQELAAAVAAWNEFITWLSVTLGL